MHILADEDGVVIMDEVFGLLAKRGRLSQLFDDPVRRWVFSNRNVLDLPPLMADDDEDVEHFERDGRHDAEIHRPYFVPVIVEKRLPGLSLLFTWRFSGIEQVLF